MNIKTTINLKMSQYVKISSIALQYDVSKSFIINLLAKKALKYASRKNCFLQRVRYQRRIDDADVDVWRCSSVSFQPDVYEKCLDLRKISKLSVSFSIALAFDRYLDQIIKELQQGTESDNYSSNYVQLHTQSGYFNQIILIWDMIDPEKLKKLKEIHT